MYESTWSKSKNCSLYTLQIFTLLQFSEPQSVPTFWLLEMPYGNDTARLAVAVDERQTDAGIID